MVKSGLKYIATATEFNDLSSSKKQKNDLTLGKFSDHVSLHRFKKESLTRIITRKFIVPRNKKRAITIFDRTIYQKQMEKEAALRLSLKLEKVIVAKENLNFVIHECLIQDILQECAQKKRESEDLIAMLTHEIDLLHQQKCKIFLEPDLHDKT